MNRFYAFLRHQNIWLIAALSIFAWGPLLTPAYFFEAHDARHSVFFLVEFDQTWRDGYLWPRWAADFAFGYGYPLFNMYAPLAFYAAELWHLAGLSFTTAIKTMYVVATIGAGWSMYGFVRRLFGPGAGLLAAIVYVYAPFHLVEIFVRSAYAEYVVLALIPLVFWAFTELIFEPTTRRLGLAALAYGSLALTHHASLFTFSPFLMAYILYLILGRRRNLLRRTLYALGGGLLGLGLAAIYLLPLVLELQYIKVDQWTSGSYNYLQHFVYFSQLVDPGWGYGYAGPGLLDDFSYQLGIVGIGLMSFALVRLWRGRVVGSGPAWFFLASSGVVILLMTPLAQPVWQALPIAALVQFPWRLLGMAAFTLAIVAGTVAQPPSLPPARGKVPPSPKREEGLFSQETLPVSRLLSPVFPPLYLLLLVVILASYPYSRPQYTEIPAWSETPLAVINWDRASIVDRVAMVSVTEVQPQTSPMEAQYLRGEPLQVAGILTGSGRVETVRHGGASDTVRVVAEEPVTVQFYTYDYPGWQVYLADRSLPHRAESPHGLITVDVPPGQHTLTLRMGGTPVQWAATIVSGLILLVIGSCFVKEFL